ncbi:unnamed protein product [Spodoptera littoralis]|uniref:Uncharacterized protein n=1 Tax=Spodoptera littoralis TaxID=7109 RepID=A0A9P0NA70_SPOLI|nr:unnamed protein product [Spodoptera littoralis]CAH1647112.1 unnamed protein product [Spodoptera littoralis]
MKVEETEMKSRFSWRISFMSKRPGCYQLLLLRKYCSQWDGNKKWDCLCDGPVGFWKGAGGGGRVTCCMKAGRRRPTPIAPRVVKLQKTLNMLLLVDDVGLSWLD